ncbi:preprotein translocase subunit SecE [Candidatus Saccharibacteria bacterium]|nr:preprotein translocase subunit SecE [Candidatus Saccharibacteria bacterium]
MAKAKITRIKANDSKKADTNAAEPVITRKKVVLKDKKAEQKDKKAKKQAEKKAVKEKSGKKPFILIRPFCFIGRYFRDSWREIRQVRWPNRKATWKMVFAVLVYTAIFVVLLVLLDMLFKFIFNQILG